MTTSLVYSAAARGVRLSAVSSELEGEMDVRGALGVSDEHRNGFSRIRMTVTISGDAPPEKLREVVMRGRQRSAVFDMVTNGVPVELDVVTERPSSGDGGTAVTPEHYDAIVVGARCAGGATALQLARQGMRTLVLDRDRPETGPAVHPRAAAWRVPAALPVGVAR